MLAEATYEQAVESLDRVVSKLKPETSSKMRSAVVAVYSSDYDQRLRFSTQICLMHLDYDRLFKTAFLRFYHLEDFSLLLEVELYYGFTDSYSLKDPALNLWGFDLWRMGTICLQFRNDLEAQLFAKKIELYAPKREALLELSKRQVEEELQKRKENSFFGKLKNIFKKPEAKKSESVVLEVVKSTSVCVDRNGNFLAEAMSAEWEEILRRSGIKPADMKKKEIAQIVLEEAIIFETKKAAEADPSILASAGLTCIKDLQEQEEQAKQQQKQELKEEPSEQRKQAGKCQQQKTRAWSDTSTSLADLPPPPSSVDFLPPPIPILDLPPPPPPPLLTTAPLLGNRVSMRRQNLLEQIRNNNIKLKPVKTNGERIQIDASQLNKEERIDLAQQIRRRLQARKAALNRQQGDSDED